MTREGAMALGLATLMLAAAGPACAHGDKGKHDNHHHGHKAKTYGAVDFGTQTEKLLWAQSEKLFGFGTPIAAPADDSDYVPREAARAGDRVKLAKGLRAHFVTRSAASPADMIAFWPSEYPYSHLIVCIEGGRATGGANPSVQRIHVNTGEVETILYGMSRCDGIRTTPWGTILATEESDDGRGYEIIDPLGTTGQWVADRSTGDIRDGIGSATPSADIVQRQALPTMAWEGLTVLPSGVVIGGDELRPGSGALDSDGGAIFKFLPATPHAGGPIPDLADSPLADGAAYALTASCQPSSSSSFPQYGQGCEIGVGAWVRVDPLNARSDADAMGATGYYRPEDLHSDPTYEGEGVRFCWTNTGNEGAGNFGEVMCAVDPTPAPADPTDVVDGRTGFAYLGDSGDFATVTANRFLEGDERFNSVDNLAFQPHSGILYVIEDHSHGEVYACLPDGADRDIKTDGCVPMLSVIDPDAEPTGFTFDGTGRVAFVNIQHGEQPDALRDFTSNPVNGATDDLLMITGFKVRR
jgi:hypothetical protein